MILIVLLLIYLQNTQMKIDNKNPTYMNSEPGSDFHLVTHYENTDVTLKPERQDEESKYHNTVYEQIQANEQITAYEGNQQEQATNYEEIKQGSSNVYEDLQQVNQLEHPYADLSVE